MTKQNKQPSLLTLNLQRFHQTDKVTIGRLMLPNELDGVELMYTLERPWKDNKKNFSCIPAGEYICKKSMYYGGDGLGGKKADYPAYEILDVPNRTHIKIHKGNYVRDVSGCIILGTTYCANTPAVFNSKRAYDRFMHVMQEHDMFQLEISQ